MSDIFPTGDVSDLDLATSINPSGYLMDQAPEDLIGRLNSHSSYRFRELGEYFTRNNLNGSGVEYAGRLARVREVSGVVNTTIEISMREKLNWGPGEVVNLTALMKDVGDGEELQIVDYKGRQYQLVRDSNGFQILGAYHQKDQPIVGQDGIWLEGKTVEISKLPTDSDRKLEEFGVSVDPYVRLVEPGQVTQQTSRGEQYTEKRNGAVSLVAASRLLMTIPDSKMSFGMLVSEMKIIPKDIKDSELLNTTQWRLRDSQQVIRSIIESDRGVDRILRPEVQIEVDGKRYTSFKFDDEGRVSFVVEDLQIDNPLRIEYVFDPNGQSSEKQYINDGGHWVVPYESGHELDGSKKVSILQAARKLDEVRYLISPTSKA